MVYVYKTINLTIKEFSVSDPIKPCPNWSVDLC